MKSNPQPLAHGPYRLCDGQLPNHGEAIIESWWARWNPELSASMPIAYVCNSRHLDATRAGLRLYVGNTQNCVWCPVAGLAKIVQRIRPQGAMHWDRVAQIFNTGRPDHIPAREVTSLRDRFKKMVKDKKPTGLWRCCCRRTRGAFLLHAHAR